MDNVTHLPARPALRMVSATSKTETAAPEPGFALATISQAIEFSAHAQTDLASTLRRIANGQPGASPYLVDDITMSNLLQAAMQGFALRGARNDERVMMDMIRYWLRNQGVPL